MYKLQNGWTKEQMIQAIKLGNNGTRSMQGNRCVYRGIEGNKCVVGVFIPDDLYYENIDKDENGMSAHYLLTDYPGLAEFMPLDKDAMSILQSIHDGDGAENKDERVHERLIEWINQCVQE